MEIVLVYAGFFSREVDANCYYMYLAAVSSVSYPCWLSPGLPGAEPCKKTALVLYSLFCPGSAVCQVVGPHVHYYKTFTLHIVRTQKCLQHHLGEPIILCRQCNKQSREPHCKLEKHQCDCASGRRKGWLTDELWGFVKSIFLPWYDDVYTWS